MWVSFFIAMLMVSLFLYLPGTLVLWVFRCDGLASFCFSPVLVVAGYMGLSIAFSIIGIDLSPWTIFAPIALVTIICAILLLISSFRKGKAQQRLDKPRNWHIAILYLAVAVVLVGFFFIRNLDGTSSFLQSYDNYQHLGTIRSIMQSSSLTSSLYPGNDINIDPYQNGTSFYPIAWHVLVALTAQSVSGLDVAAAVNVVNSVLAGVVFPISIFYFLSVLFNDRKLVLAGSLVAMASTALPWDWLIYGPLYPNLLAYALVPIVMANVANFFRLNPRGMSFWKNIAAFILGGCVLCLSHPNAVFAAAMVMAPFFVAEVYRLAEMHFGAETRSKRKALAVSALTAVVILAIWCFFYKLPSFRSVVQFNWAATQSIWQSIIDVIFQSFNSHPANLLLAMLVAAGIANVFVSKRHQWLIPSFFISAVTYILSIATEGRLKHVLSGFWYTDPHRTAATLALVSIPLAALGLAYLHSLLIPKILQQLDRVLPSNSIGIVKISALLYIIVLGVLCIPNFSLRGIADITTPFGSFDNEAYWSNTEDAVQILDAEERDFAERAFNLVPDDSLILNCPNDGSAYLYGLYGARLYYRNFIVLPGETEESILIREDLDQLESNYDVKTALDTLDAGYILLLDLGGERTDERRYFPDWCYVEEQWEGFNTIDDSTPGLTLLLSEGDMRLYQIDR